MKVNGNILPLEKSISVLDYLVSQNFDAMKVAVELNGQIVPKATYEDVLLKEEDTLEIVRFVGGG
jgi:thiamine biosynthesis protein ThiS